MKNQQDSNESVEEVSNESLEAASGGGGLLRHLPVVGDLVAIGFDAHETVSLNKDTKKVLKDASINNEESEEYEELLRNYKKLNLDKRPSDQ